jgi:PAS domain S-box-containing protein
MIVAQSLDKATSTRRELPTIGKSSLLGIPSSAVRYGLAILFIGLSLGLALLLQHFRFEQIEFPIFLIAIAITVWYVGTGPAILALVLASLAFNYYFTAPYYSFYVTRAEIPYYAIFVLFALLITWFATLRKRVERELIESRDELERQVAIRTRQASLLDLTHDSIFVRDMNDVIIYWNRGAQELYGWTPEQAAGKRTDELLGTVFPKPFHEIHAELLRTGRWEGEVEKTRADGTRVLVATRWSLQRDENATPVAILESENDITDRRRRENEIHDLNRELAKRSTELEGTNKELEAFAYSISHDLRAPLRHMVGYTELLQKHASALVDDKGRRYMMMILEAAKRMGNLIDDLLAFSRIGRAETRVTMVSLGQLVSEVQNEVWQDTEGRNMTWKIGPLPDLYGDKSMLKLALVNVISNAVKFTRTQSAPQIEIGYTDHPNNGAVLFIRDNGVGFDMKYVNKLFGVFQRLHRADEFEGTGIGLATVQRIIHRHGGRVWAEGQVGVGATFYLSLPKP